MAWLSGLGERLDAAVARRVDTPLPPSRGLGRHVAPLPTWLENLVLRLVWPVVLANLLGTAFGFYYYLPQLAETPVVAWPLVPVSPLATLYMGLSLAVWRLGFRGRLAQLLHVLAVIGCLKYGLWTVVVQLFIEDTSTIPFALWQFLVWSHAAMAVQAFVVQRYAEFPTWAIAVAVGWFTLNDLLDYFLAVAGGPHHTWLNVLWDDGPVRSIAAYDHVAAVAVFMLVLGTVLAFATRIAILETRGETVPE